MSPVLLWLSWLVIELDQAKALPKCYWAQWSLLVATISWTVNVPCIQRLVCICSINLARLTSTPFLYNTLADSPFNIWYNAVLSHSSRARLITTVQAPDKTTISSNFVWNIWYHFICVFSCLLREYIWRFLEMGVPPHHPFQWDCLL